MKTPLRYQVTEFDCGTISLLNAISYLYDRKNIPADLVRAIHLYTIDCYDDEGFISNAGTSKQAIEYLAKWITNYSFRKDFGINCAYLTGEKVNYDSIIKCIRSGGVAFIKYLRDEYQYAIITNINELNTYMFDSYYLDDDYYDKDDEVRIVQSKPLEYNRIVRTSRVFLETNKDFSLGKIENRECVLMNKKGKEK